MLPNGCIITSTENIAIRAGIAVPSAEVPMNTYLTFDENLAMHISVVKTDNIDLQKVDYETETIRL
jgi:hypothetical protein